MEPKVMITAQPPARTNVQLFLGTLISAFLLIVGIGTLAAMFAPAVLGFLTPHIIYQPHLPLAEDRTEPFLDIDAIPTKQLYPALSSPDNVTSGDWIRIPSINVAVPLALSPSINDRDVLQTLDRGAALYPNGIQPGRLGNTFVSAHSTGEPWKGKYRFAFLKMNEVQAGNLIHLDYRGTRYTYTVAEKNIITPSPNFRIVSDRPVPTVTLMACWPLWTTKQRLLLKGELTNITKLTPSPV